MIQTTLVDAVTPLSATTDVLTTRITESRPRGKCHGQGAKAPPSLQLLPQPSGEGPRVMVLTTAREDGCGLALAMKVWPSLFLATASNFTSITTVRGHDHDHGSQMPPKSSHCPNLHERDHELWSLPRVVVLTMACEDGRDTWTGSLSIWIDEQSKDTNLQKETKRAERMKKSKPGDHQVHLVSHRMAA
uniref:Uncharacterized protein n=1 Tax=Solanum tuberosum TaxID=4113 RepID=M1DCG1_SOLTU